ncbi:Cytochrome b-c1 complex subunit 7, mitochondrial [Savitreella phatthalungensis]
MAGAPSFAAAVMKSPGLKNLLTPLAKTYARMSGYRQMGLKYDDLIPEENDTMQRALGRLSDREAYDRAFRLRNAQQLSLQHQLLPQDKWIKESEDTRYVTPLADEIHNEAIERAEFDNLRVK